jgi:hypothetical protein
MKRGEGVSKVIAVQDCWFLLRTQDSGFRRGSINYLAGPAKTRHYCLNFTLQARLPTSFNDRGDILIRDSL